ncbi:hypothetical protein GGR53DRAFT_521799 [Hypoxylon sp. FL1150]|nr:hypothetical protein GGR53DRAFT_521799 [Hypoxylon sp. FL1150]
MNSVIQQLCKCLQAPAAAKRYRDAGMGLAFVALNQLLVVPIQILLGLHSINLPASILVMFLFWCLMMTASYIHQGTGQFYSKHIRGPADFLGRHMSFGFVASFIMLNRDHISNAVDILRVTGAFGITTLVGYIGTYLLASGTVKLEYRCRGPRFTADDLESNSQSWPSPSAAWPAPPADRSANRISQLPPISAVLVENRSLVSMLPATKDISSQIIDCLTRAAPMWICIFLIIAVGIPVYFATGFEALIEALFFVLFWIIAVQFQRWLKGSAGLLLCPRLRSILVIFSNPVVITWALGTAYMWIKVACTHRAIGLVVSEFHRHNSLAEGVRAVMDGASPQSHIGAGDLAGPILDAGIACMGFKMFEYRKELWESFVTVLTTCSVLAATNISVNVLVAHALGLQKKDAIAFAARCVTIAMGVPTMDNLDGSITLMSSLVIFGGILFQMAGDWLFSLLQINDRASQQKLDEGSRSDSGKSGARALRNTHPDAAVIAAGVTVGINAAAMGTAHLIERDSKAMAYSALSMTVFGAIVVALTAVPGVSEAMITLASR